jgi:DNA-binding CsgD family transcriptional regulator
MRVLLEREREIAELGAVRERARGGRGCAIAIEASAGLGKTRLLQEARADGTQAGLAVLAARATELEQSFPFALVRQLFESPLAGLPAEEREAVLEGATAARGALGLDSEVSSDSFAVLHGLYWVTAALAERQSLLLAIDDAHWADAASLDYLGFLLPRLEELPVLLILTCRPEEPDPSGGLRQVLADPSIRRLSPLPLSAEATIDFLAEEFDRPPDPPFATACHEISGGNPFLLSELARTLVRQKVEPIDGREDLVRALAPEQVARSVLTRLARLAPEAGALARSLAVFGDGAEPHLVAELAHLDPDQAAGVADELRAASIFDKDPSLRFIHPLVRNGIYTGIPVGERTQAHARAAVLLRDRGASPEQVATQLLATGGREDRAAVETLIEAGERALDSGAPRSATAYLTRALREPPPAELRVAVLEPLVMAGFRAADRASWAAIKEDVLAEVRRDPSLGGRWELPLIAGMTLEGRLEEAGGILKKAIDVALAEGDMDRAFRVEAQLRTIGTLLPTLPKVDLSRYADRIDPDSPAGRLAASMEAASAADNGSRVVAVEAAERALGNDYAIFTEEPELVASSVPVMILLLADELGSARRAAERALTVARGRGATLDLIQAWYLSGLVACAYGDLIGAEADMRQVIDLARLAGVAPLLLTYTGSFVEVLIERDQLREAELALQAVGVGPGPMPENELFTRPLVSRTHLRFAQGDIEGTVEGFMALVARTEKTSMARAPAVSVSPLGVRSLVAIGERERAREIADGMMAHIRGWGTPAGVAHVLRARAVSRGGAEEIELLEEAAAMTDGSDRRLQRAHILADLGAALRREGRRADARAPLREALELARRGGMARIARRAREELQATGETVRRYAPIGVESLTPSERRVAELAASGMTNRQIAQSLFVTVKTVEAHLSAAYDKLDIDSRRQLSRALGEGS